MVSTALAGFAPVDEVRTARVEVLGGIAAGGAATVEVPLPRPFQHTDYSVLVTLQTTENLLASVFSRAADRFTIQVLNNGSGPSAAATAHCLVVADARIPSQAHRAY